jgi:hypothetical protein
MRVRQVILSVKWVPLKLTTGHLPAIIMLAPTSKTQTTYQAMKAFGLLSREKAKERPRYKIAAMARDDMTNTIGKRVIRYLHEKYPVKPYWKKSTILLNIKIKDSC